MLIFQESKLEKYLAISAAFAICVIRMSTALGEVATGIALLLGLVLWHKNKESVSVSEDIKGYMKAYGVFLLLLVPSVVFSGNAAASVKEFFRFWVWRFMIFAVVAVFIQRREYLVNMLTAYLSVSSIEFLYTLVEMVQKLKPHGRGVGFGVDHMVLTLGGILCMLLPIVLVILMDSGFEKRLKKAASLAVISILIGQLCNKSRGAWLTDLIVVPIAIFRYLKHNKKYLVIVLAVFFGIAGFMASNPHYVQRVQSITNTTTDQSNADRIRVWKSAKAMVQEHPVTGVGPGRFREHYKKYRFKQERQNLTHAHNNFIQITIENGITGLAGLLCFVGYFLCKSLRNYRKKNNPYDILVFTTIFGYICLFGQIDYSLGSSTGVRIMWFLLAVLLKLKETDRKRCEIDV